MNLYVSSYTYCYKQLDTGNLNAQSQWRVDLARRIAPYYAAYPNVNAVVLLGGAARGWADSYSDIDLVVYWREVPTEAERHAVIETLGAHPGEFGDTFTNQPDPNLRYWWEEYYLGGDEHTGFKIDLGHHLAADMDAVIEAVTQRLDLHSLKHEMLYSIRRMQTFYGDALIERWKQAAAQYPEALASKLVEQHLRLQPFWITEACIERGDWLLFNFATQEVCKRLLMAICALNREYFPGTKRQAYLLSELAILPENFNQRLNAILRGDAQAAVTEVYRLYDDIYTLAQQHVPQADLARARERFIHKRAQWYSAP
jgi:predicted nucleotidyltransferase